MNLLKNILQYFKHHILLLILLLIFLISIVSASAFYLLENTANQNMHSFGQALWWVFITITTVGYGDVVPVTQVGQILGVLVIFTGIVLVSMFTAITSSVFVAKRLREEKGLQAVNEKNHLILCGWNHTAEKIISTIFNQNKENTPIVIITKAGEDVLQSILFKYKSFPLFYIRGDFSQENILNKANIAKAKSVIIIPDNEKFNAGLNDEKTILTAFTVKAINPKIKVFTHITEKENAAYLKKAQVDDYIISDDFSGLLMGEMVTSPGVSQSVSAILGNEQNNRLSRINIPEQFFNKPFGELFKYLRAQHLTPIALVKENKPVSIADIISKDDSYLDAFIEKKFKAAGRTLQKGPKLDIQINPADDVIIEKETFAVVIK